MIVAILDIVEYLSEASDKIKKKRVNKKTIFIFFLYLTLFFDTINK